MTWVCLLPHSSATRSTPTPPAGPCPGPSSGPGTKGWPWEGLLINCERTLSYFSLPLATIEATWGERLNPHVYDKIPILHLGFGAHDVALRRSSASFVLPPVSCWPFPSLSISCGFLPPLPVKVTDPSAALSVNSFVIQIEGGKPPIWEGSPGP